MMSETVRGKTLTLRKCLPLCLVVVPIILGVFYYAVSATDYYVSEAAFTIQSPEQGSSVSIETFLGSSPAFGSDKDAYAVQNYLLSRDILQRLDAELQFRDHYQDPSIDWVSRLASDATFEEMFEYFKDRVSVQYDPQTGVTELEVRALTPEKARQIAGALVSYGEEMVNRLSDRARSDQMVFAQSELHAAEQRLTDARQAILAYQREGSDINPADSATAVLEIRNQLEGELARSKAELRELTAFMRPDTHKVVALEQRIKSLEQQIEAENQKLVAPGASSSLSVSIAQFEPLLIEKEFAEKAYESALASLELARVEASKQHRYLATVAVPSLPDESTYPDRPLSILAVILVVLFVYGIGRLVVVAVMEHQRL